jgi:hypothetical protein
MEPETSLHFSQEPTLSQINPVHTTPCYLSKIYFNIISTTYILVFLVVSFLLAFPPISYMHVPIHATCSAHLILLD